MDRVPEETLKLFVSQKYHWKALSPSLQMAMAKELLFLHEAINSGLDELYEANAEARDTIDAFNELTHRKRMRP